MADKKEKPAAKGAAKEKAPAKAAGKRKPRKEVTPTAASDRPVREHKEPKRFEFAEPAPTSRRKRAAAEKKKKQPAAKRRKTGKKGGKKTRAKKDPDAPKSPRTAFMYFSQENRDDVKKDNPDISFGDIGKELGKQWRKLKAADKKKYEKMAEKDKQRYEKEKGKYEAKKSDKEESESD